MTITFTDETPEATPRAPATDTRHVVAQQPDFADLASQLKACFHVLSVIEICASVDPATLTAEIEVKVFGKKVAEGTLSAAHPCLKVDVHPHAGGLGVKLEVEICLDISAKSVTVDGKACVEYVVGHKCAHLHKHTIIHF